MDKIPVPQSTDTSHAFTRLDLIASLAAVVLFVAIIVPALANSNSRSDRVACMSNLRQIGVAYTHFGLEHNDLPPWYVSSRDGGTADYNGGIPGLAARNQLYVQFSVLSNSLPSPRYLADPSDLRAELKVARSWSLDSDGGLYHINHRQRSISYFIGLRGTFRTPRYVLAGDRNVATEGSYVTTCAAGVSPASALNPSFATWTNDVHGLSGNLLFYDGSVEQTSTPRLRDVLWENHEFSPGNICALFPF
jgi:prepilin-type processing-associated H-X9-DG protein